MRYFMVGEYRLTGTDPASVAAAQYSTLLVRSHAVQVGGSIAACGFAGGVANQFVDWDDPVARTDPSRCQDCKAATQS
jgi:ABC-type uncharacterized transport system permease subunit